MKIPLKIANVCVASSFSLSLCPSLANAITVELCRNASIYCEMAVIDFRLCCVCVYVSMLFDIFARVLAK